MAPTNFKYDFYSKARSGLNRDLDAKYLNSPPVLRLTKTNDQGKAENNSTGRVLYSKTVQFGHEVSFDTTVKFTITANDSLKAGDGLAFFIVPEVHDFPEAGGNFGIFSSKVRSAGVFAVVLDFSIEKEHPNLVIDIGSKVPKNQIQVPNEFVGKQLTLNVSYDAKTGEISSFVKDEDGETFPLSYSYKLSQILPSRVSVGLASSTSEAAAIHDVNSWEFTSTDPVKN